LLNITLLSPKAARFIMAHITKLNGMNFQ
jgi:hypothetical protein